VSIEAQSDCPVHLTAGQTLTLTLPSNPTTGFRWQVRNPASNVLRSLGPEVYSSAEQMDMVGGAGQSVWRYKASGAGTGRLLMVYQQPWAPEVTPQATFDCPIVVH
jgi:inhibitor of cysteine peptidase